MAYVTVEAKGLGRLADKLADFPKESHAAMRSALNRTVNRVATNMTKEVAAEYAVKRQQVKKTIKIKKASGSNLTAEADTQDRRIKLGSFAFKVSNPSTVRTPISVKVKNTNGFKQSTVNPPIFAGRSRVTGKQDLFRRTPNSAYKIGWLFTLSIPQMTANPDVYKRISDDANDFMLKRFEHELDYRLKRLAGAV